MTLKVEIVFYFVYYYIMFIHSSAEGHLFGSPFGYCEYGVQIPVPVLAFKYLQAQPGVE